MVNALNYLSGKYINAERLPNYDRRLTAVIAAAGPELMELSHEEKLVLTLRSTGGKQWPQKVVVNVTNGKILVAAFGGETNDWIGQAIELWQAPTQFGRDTVAGIKLAALNGAGAAMPALEAKPVTMPPVTPPSPRDQINQAVPLAPHQPNSGDLDDEIPW